MCGFVQLVLSLWTLRAPGEKGLSKMWGCISEALRCASSTWWALCCFHLLQVPTSHKKKKMWWFGFGFKRNAHVKKSVEFGLKCGSSSLRTLLNHRVWLQAALQPLRCELVPGLPFFQMLLQCGFMDTWKSGCCVLHVPIFWAFPRLGFQSVTEFLSEFMYVCIYVWLTQYNTVVLHGRNADPPRMELTTALCAKIPIF